MGLMRVTIVSRIYRPEPSAASVFLGAVADALTARGDEVDVITSRPPRGTPPASARERVRAFPVLRDRSGYVRGYVQYLSFDIPLLFRLLFTRRPDVVVVEPPPTTGAVVRIVCAIRRIPYVYDAADVWADATALVTTSRTIRSAVLIAERFAMRGAAHLITISTGVVDRVRAHRVETPITVTGFGAMTEGFEPTGRIEPVLLYAGTAADLHGASIFVDAFAILRRSYPDLRLRFVGNLTAEDQLRARASSLDVLDAVEFRPSIPTSELAPELARASIALASVKPGTGYDYAFATKIYSAWSAGCPVVFAGAGPTAALIAEANRIVRAGRNATFDPNDVATALASLLEAPPSREERAALSSWTQREHSIGAVADRVAAVIDQVASTLKR